MQFIRRTLNSEMDMHRGCLHETVSSAFLSRSVDIRVSSDFDANLVFSAAVSSDSSYGDFGTPVRPTSGFALVSGKASGAVDFC